MLDSYLDRAVFPEVDGIIQRSQDRMNEIAEGVPKDRVDVLREACRNDPELQGLISQLAILETRDALRDRGELTFNPQSRRWQHRRTA